MNERSGNSEETCGVWTKLEERRCQAQALARDDHYAARAVWWRSALEAAKAAQPSPLKSSLKLSA